MRYLILITINLPIVFLAFLNIITQYKMKRIDKERFIRQTLLWLIISLVLILAFPIYNLANGRAFFSSVELSFFDIAEITSIVFLFYTVNNQIRKLNNTERRLRDLHQEMSIILSESELKNGKN
ncbi:MAG: DUF2304 family protein [Candidatus Nanogingivalis sp.]